MSRLRSFETDDIVGDINTPSDIEGPLDDAGHSNRTDVWEDLGDSQHLGYNVLKPPASATCELITCVSSAGASDVACLDLRQLNMSAGAFSASKKTVPLESKLCGDLSGVDFTKVLNDSCAVLLRD